MLVPRVVGRCRPSEVRQEGVSGLTALLFSFYKATTFKKHYIEPFPRMLAHDPMLS